MKKVPLAVLLLCSAAAWSQQASPTDYPISVHVVSSTLVLRALGTRSQEVTERLRVVVSGKNYELEGKAPIISGGRPGVIAPGDYKAKLKDDVHKGSYLTNQEYEILFPDGSNATFTLTSESE